MFQTKQKDIFRKVALERLSSPEELDQLMQVTTSKGWLALISLGILLIAALIWGFFGSIPTTVDGQGILLRTEGVYNIPAVAAGQVTAIYVRVGDAVAEGQTVARISQVGAGSATGARIVSPQAGRVMEIRTTEGSVVNAGTPIISIEALDRESKKLEAIIYLSSADGKKAKVNMPVEVTPSTVKRQDYGFIPGRIVSVSEFPVTKQGMARILGSEELADQFSNASGGALIEIRAQLAEDPNSVSGYRWSSKGPNITIENGTPFTVKVITEQRRPITLIIPLLREWFTGPLFGSGT
jgi:multidrug efflux pump subunit AcrA (membrane-fusion protein)